MKDDIKIMFNAAYANRRPLFGNAPTECVVKLSSMLKSGSNIVDLGCGDGRDTLFLLGKGFTLTAIDLCENAISSLIQRAEVAGLAERLIARTADVLDWCPKPQSLDAVIAVTLLDHIPKPRHRDLINTIEVGIRDYGFIALETYSDRDPSITGEGEEISEFAHAIVSPSEKNYLLSIFYPKWRILDYSDRIEDDRDHGRYHKHGFTTILARKERQ